MTMRLILPKPSPVVVRTEWSGFKLCDPLGEWRPDVPDLWPTCTACDAPIKTGDRYAIAYPLSVVCLPCSGIRVPGPPAKRATIVSAAERQFGSKL